MILAYLPYLFILSLVLISIDLNGNFNGDWFFVLVRSSSTEPPSVGDPDPGSVCIEKDGRSRGYGEALSSSNVPMESLALTSKQRRDKLSNKGQQDEEEERGNSIPSSSLLPLLSSFHSFQNSSKSTMVMLPIVTTLPGPYPFSNKRVTRKYSYVSLLPQSNSLLNSLFISGSRTSHIPYQ